ncbi:MAG: response regulator [Lachnospiraceae bacterium]|nr:response regulator [Lachnospiraceae bacterium]
MNILIVDDEYAAIVDIRKVLNTVVPDAQIFEAGNAEEAMAVCERNDVHVVFLDVEMPGKNGLLLAEDIKKVRPMANIVILTAYEQYALDAHKKFVSGYLLKPALTEEVKKVLDNLRYPVPETRQGLYIRCFGTFEVFYNGEIVKFGRALSKEVLAYLIDRNGASVTGAEICSILWEDEFDGSEKYKNYLYHIYDDLQESLNRIGYADILSKSRNSYAVYPDKIDCDYYRALRADPRAAAEFRGEYMTQYSWAESRLGSLISNLMQE